MDTNDNGTSFDQPRPEVPPASGPPILPPPSLGPPPPLPLPLPLFTPYEGAPTATVVPTGTAGKRSRGKVVGGLIAVVALVGAGGFAISKIVAGNDGGAANPTEVGTRLMDALAAEDALGAVDLLLPGERDMMRQPLIDIVDNLKRLEIADSSATLDKVGGLDIAFDDVQVDLTETNVDDVVDIRITASGTASVDGENVPIGQLLIDEAFGGDRPELGSGPEESDVDWKLATVRHDGRWYLSAFYSIAENARESGDDIPESSLVARGADTPEGAVQAIFDAVDDLDLEALIASLNPNEAEALQRYAPMFVDDAQEALDDQDIELAFSDTKFSVSGGGDRRTVAVDGFNMTAAFQGDEVTVESKGGCMVVTSGDTTTDSCEGGSSADTAITALGLDDNEDVQALIKTVQDAFDDMKPVGITVQLVGGKWFLSPVGTVADILLAVMTALDKEELTDMIDGVKKVIESVSTEGIFSSGDVTTIGDEGDDSDFSGLDACFGETEYAEFSACVASGIDDGTIDATFVPPYFRFEECGVGEQYFNGDVYGMSDEEFTTFATDAAPCFQQHVADGTISEFELPYELSRPDCMEGKNWYNVTDEDYNDRVFDCVS
ncbi:MAG: hypothetical protein M3P52_05525 [Actinomycetota bacterium]|nr:hypothetical protein [Actinomycetota bacterium]